VVLVHGFSVPYYLWDPTFEALAAAGYRVLRYDLFGRGYSDRPDLAYDGDLFDRQLVELLDELKIKGEVDVVGASMGGPIVAGFGCRHAERVRTISLFDPGFSHGQELPFKVRAPLIGEYFMAVRMAPELPARQSDDFLHPEKFPDWAEKYRAQMRYKGFRRALLSTLRHYVTADWSKEYTCIGGRGKPVFLVWGQHDKDVRFELNKEVRAAIPAAEFLPVEDAAHVPFLEHPEIVNPALLRFLAAH
jgi:pimeloyl-ACP methyl ester carboxylesterase